MRNEEPIAVGDDERVTLLALAGDLPGLWNDAAASVETRKRILRAVLKEIVVTAETGRLHLVLHWQGGDHTRLEVLKNRSGQNRFKTDAATEQLVSELARLLPDHSIAPVLNRLGIGSARGQTWTQLRVRNFRGAHQIPAYREGERARQPRHLHAEHEADVAEADLGDQPLKAQPSFDARAGASEIVVDDGRVGTKDCSFAPLTEPDMRASHPALWIDISELQHELGRNLRWVETVPHRFE